MQVSLKVGSDMDAQLEKLQQRIAWWRQDPGNASLYRQCADMAMALRRYDLLLELVNSALAQTPDDPVFRFDRATAQIGLREYRAALASMAEPQPQSAEQEHAITANRGLCHYCLSEYEQALTHLKREYDRSVRTPELLLMLVRSNHHLGQLDEAVALAKANEQMAQSDAVLAGAYALLYLDADDAAGASRWATTALRLNPRSIDGGVTEATLAVMRLQTDRAGQLFDAVLETHPETARAWIGLGMLALLRRDLQRGRSHFERGLELMPEHVGSWHMLGWIQLLQSDLEGAEKTFNQALTLDRNFAETHATLAVLDVVRGDTDSAKRRIAVAKRLDPNCFSAQYAEALLLDPTLRGARSQQILQQVLQNIAGQNQSALSRLLLKRQH